MLVAAGWPEVAFESAVGTKGTARMRLANTGSTVIYFRWQPATAAVGAATASAGAPSMLLDATLPLGNTAERFTADVAAGDASGSAAEFGRSRGRGASVTTTGLPAFVSVPSAAAAAKGPRFICAHMAGSIMPGASMDFVFTFESAAAGVFTERWMLVTTPAANGGTPVVVTLRGVATFVDEAAPRRARLEGRLREAAAFAVVRSVLDGLLDALELEPPPPPPREEKVRADSARFARANPGLFYHEDVYNALESEVALPALAALGYAPRRRVWDGSIAHLAASVARVLPPPETAAELEATSALEAQAAAEEEAEIGRAHV